MDRGGGSKSLVPLMLLALSIVWLGYEVAQRVVPPRVLDEQGRVAELKAKDPKPGAPFPVEAKGASGRVAFVWLAGCSSCSKHALRLADAKAACPKGTELVLLVAPTNDEAGREDHLPTVVLDHAAQVRINAYFAPRTYIVERGTLTKVQSRDERPLDVIGGPS